MTAYQKYGVITVTVIFVILQKLKFQNFRLIILYDCCRASSNCGNTSLSNISDIYFQNESLYDSCMVLDGCENSASVPNNSDTFFEDENLNNFLYKSLIVSNCLSVLPCILLAAWSDRHGRKLLLILPYIGSFISDIFTLIVLYVPFKATDVLLVSEGIYGLCGGTVLISMGCLCYITDSTDHRKRTWSFAWFLGIYNLAPVTELILQFFWTPLEAEFNFHILVMVGVFIRMVVAVCILIYIKMCVSESVFVLGSYYGSPWVNLITPINVSDTLSCVFKRRLDNMRFFILVLTTIFILYSISLHGNLVAFPLYFRDVFHWSYQKLLIFSASFTVIQTTTLWISAYLGTSWRTLDSDLGTYGCLSLALSCLVLSFSRHFHVAIAGTALGAGSLLVPVSIISVLSKLVERVETGSMFAGIGFLTLVTQLIAIPSYRALTQVCKEDKEPQLIFLLSFGLAAFGSFIFIYLRRNIAPDLLGHLDGSESLALINRRQKIEQLF